MWICIENGLEVLADIFTYLAASNAKLGSPVSFYIASAINLFLIIFESIEIVRTRSHGGKQTEWDRFYFGQARRGLTRKP